MKKPVSGLLKNGEIGLFADFYEFTMGKADLDHGNFQTVTENYFIRHVPQGSYLLAAGLEQFIHYVLNIRFTKTDLDWLKRTAGGDISDDFLEYLRNFKFTGDVYAVPEGTPVFPNEPVINVTGPSIDVQLFETYLLSVMNFQTLVATKAARIVCAARGRSVTDFGARRAHGRDAAIMGARAAYIGGVGGTSLVIAGKKWGIPYSGTMAHKFIQFYPSEIAAFRAYMESFPDKSILLIDTFNTIDGAKNAAIIGREINEKGYKLLGVRLDSGDLMMLSKKVRKILDNSGLSEVKIIASSELDEFEIARLLKGKAPIDAFGVGTRLITGANFDPDTGYGGVSALGGIYKLVEVISREGIVLPKTKFSDDAVKSPIPSKKQIYRKVISGAYFEDIICSWDEKPDNVNGLYPLLIPIMVKGKLVYDFPALKEIQKYTGYQLSQLPLKYKKLRNASIYPVKLSPSLKALRKRLLDKNNLPATG